MNEETLIQRLLARFPAMPSSVEIAPGDDCAAIHWREDTLLLVTVDQLIGDRHYLPSTAPQKIGGKLLARNISDIAAMGGTPLFCVLAMAFDKGQPPERLEAIAEGIGQTAQSFNIAVVGGDLAMTPTDEVFSLTLLGVVEREFVCRRSTARPGDILCMTGLAGAAFETEHHLNFIPRIKEGQWLACNNRITAMIDISDGVALDAARLATASNLAITIDLNHVPRRNPDQSPEKAVTDGEDYELLFTVCPDQFESLIQSWPFDTVPLTRIGHCHTGTPNVYDQNQASLTDGRSAGFDHFNT